MLAKRKIVNAYDYIDSLREFLSCTIKYADCISRLTMVINDEAFADFIQPVFIDAVTYYMMSKQYEYVLGKQITNSDYIINVMFDDNANTLIVDYVEDGE